MQDFTGVPAVVDLAAMRDAMVKLGGDPNKINPLVPVDLVIDHSVVVDYFGTAKSLGQNVKREYEQNQERYRFLKWGQQAFSNFSVVPPGTGICHQVNLEYLAQTVWTAKEKRDGKTVEVAYPDTLVGTDSHTTMVNGLAVLGWGVGGIEAEAAMLGQPLSMLLPEVIGFKLTGELREGVTATDLVLTVTQMLRKKGVVGKFVEFFGPGLNAMSVADRATLANMAPEYGATCGLFPIDAQAIDYPQDHGPQERAHRAGRGLRQGAGHVPHPPDARSGLHRHAGARPRRSRALARRPEAPAGPRAARRCEGGLRRRDDERVQAGRHAGRALQGRGRELRPRPRRRRDRGDHLLHQHLEPERDDRGRPRRPQRGRQGPDRQALGEDLAGAGQPGRRRLSRSRRIAEAARQARLQHRRLRLHDLHRQFGPARAGDFGDDLQEQSRRGGGAVGQSQFRGPRQSRRARQLSRLAAAGGRLCARRLDADRPDQGPDRQRQAGQAGLSRRHLAVDAGGARPRRVHHQGQDVQDQIRQRVRRRHELEEGQGARPARPTPGTWARPMCRTRPISRA